MVTFLLIKDTSLNNSHKLYNNKMLNSLLVFAKRGGATPHLTPPEHTPFEKLLLQKRALIETVIGQLGVLLHPLK
jgi:hypothetical protein